MKPGTHVRLPDGRTGTVVYHGLDGYGIRWGLLNLAPSDVASSAAALGLCDAPDGYDLEAEAMLRDPYPSASIECVGTEYEVLA